MTLVGEIKLESLIAGQHSMTRGNRSDHMNDKQAFPRLWHLCPSGCDKHPSMWQEIHKSGSSMFIVQSDTGGAKTRQSFSIGRSDSLMKTTKTSKNLWPQSLCSINLPVLQIIFFTLFIYLFISTEDIFRTNTILIPPNIAKLM